MNNKIDFLLIEPSLDWKKTKEIRKSMRIEKDRPVKEGLKISSGYLVSAVKHAGHNVKFIDMIAESYSVEDLLEYIRNNNPRVIGMPAFTFQIPMVGELCRRVKEVFPNIITCAGGCHVTRMPERTLREFPHIDFVINGEAETSLPIIIDRIKNGIKLSDIDDIKGLLVQSREKKTKLQLFTRFDEDNDDNNENIVEDVKTLNYPAWEEFNVKKYAGHLTFENPDSIDLPMLTARGCPFKCIFCCRQSGTEDRRRTVESVIDEIKRNLRDFNCTVISFLDETFVMNKEWLYEFFEAMKVHGLNEKIRWSCTTRVSSVSAELLKGMKEAGCYYIFYGFESANKEVIKIMRKGISAAQMQAAVVWAKEAGIVPTGSFIVGLAGDTRSSVLESVEFGTNLDLYSITFPIAVPFPGTELRKMAIRGDYGMRIISDDWSEYLANDFDAHGKGQIGHLESEDLLWGERRELQRLAYKKNPKKQLLKYMEDLKSYETK